MNTSSKVKLWTDNMSLEDPCAVISRKSSTAVMMETLNKLNLKLIKFRKSVTPKKCQDNDSIGEGAHWLYEETSPDETMSPPGGYDAYAEYVAKEKGNEKVEKSKVDLPLEYKIPENPIEYNHLLQDMVLLPSPPAKYKDRATYKSSSRRTHQMKNFAGALINRCPYEWLSKISGRKLPLYRTHPELHYVHPNHGAKQNFLPAITKEELLRHYNPNPCCEIYEWWLRSKKLEENDIFQTLTVKDLKKIHTLPPGQLEASMALKRLAQKSAEKRKLQSSSIKKNPDEKPETCIDPNNLSPISLRKSLLNPQKLSASIRNNKGL